MQTTMNSAADILLRNRIRVMRVILYLFLALSILGTVGPLVTTARLQIQTVIIAVISIGMLGLIQWGYFRLAANLMVILLTISSFLGARELTATLALVAAASLAGRSVFIFSNVVVLSTGVMLIYSAIVAVSPTSDTTALRSAILSEVFPFIGLIVTSFTLRYFLATANETTEQSVRSNNLLETSATVGAELSAELNLNTLLNKAVNLIQERFDFYHVQVFLVGDDRTYANLASSTGEAGDALLARQHRLAVGSQSVIGQVTQLGESVIASDTDQDVTHSRNELLPNTRSELALPMIDGARIIGALDVQSTMPDAFSVADVQALQVMANQLAASVRIARLFEQQAATLDENQKLLNQSEENLREIRRLNQQLTGQAWSDYLERDRIVAGVTLDGQDFRPGADWSDAMQQAGNQHQTVIDQAEEKHIVAVPITLRDEVLGVVEVALAQGQRKDNVEMIEAIAERLAISLDNARLFEETQDASLQEQQISEIVSQYQSAASIDELLQITLRELHMTLGADKSAIRLGQPEQETQNLNGKHKS